VRDDVKLLLTELITNVIIHAHTEFEVRLQASGAGVRVEVIDGNRTMPVAGTLTANEQNADEPSPRRSPHHCTFAARPALLPGRRR
jgi:anti-sigma regulatory factor (Ser/Thr protein kinase)